MLADRTEIFMNEEALTLKNENEIMREGVLYLEKDGNFVVSILIANKLEEKFNYLDVLSNIQKTSTKLHVGVF